MTNIRPPASDGMPPVLLLHNLDPAWPPQDIAYAAHEAALIVAALREAGHPVISRAVHDGDLQCYLRDHSPQEVLVFNTCEELPGMERSDALVAQTLETLGFVYTGSPAEVLALSWDKPAVNRLLDGSGLPVPRWRVYQAPEPDGWECFPAIVKPAFAHSSIGVTSESVVLTPDELTERVAAVLREHGQPALVEDMIDGREFHVSLWGNGSVHMLPPVEMDFSAFENVRDRVCTYESKFCPGSRHYEGIQTRLPADLRPEEKRRLEQVSRAAYRALGCRDYARLDIRLRDGVFYVLDVNPNPDISSDASVALAAEEAGYPFAAMVCQIVRLAAQRHPRWRRQFT
jgi:D-alanine-D-alanine ligase